MKQFGRLLLLLFLALDPTLGHLSLTSTSESQPELISVEEITAAFDLELDGYVNALEIQTILDCTREEAVNLFTSWATDTRPEIPIDVLSSILIRLFGGKKYVTPGHVIEVLFSNSPLPQRVERFARLRTIAKSVQTPPPNALTYHEATGIFRNDNSIITATTISKLLAIKPDIIITAMGSMGFDVSNFNVMFTPIPVSYVVRWLDYDNDGLIVMDDLRYVLNVNTAKATLLLAQLLHLSESPTRTSAFYLSSMGLHHHVYTITITAFIIMIFAFASQLSYLEKDDSQWNTLGDSSIRYIVVLAFAYMTAIYCIYLLSHLVRNEIRYQGTNVRNSTLISMILISFFISFVVCVAMESLVTQKSFAMYLFSISGILLMMQFSRHVLNILRDKKTPTKIREILRPVLIHLWLIVIFAITYHMMADDFGTYQHCIKYSSERIDQGTGEKIRDCEEFEIRRKIETFLDALFFSMSTHMTVGFGFINALDSVRARFAVIVHCLITLILNVITIQNSFASAETSSASLAKSVAGFRDAIRKSMISAPLSSIDSLRSSRMSDVGEEGLKRFEKNSILDGSGTIEKHSKVQPVHESQSMSHLNVAPLLPIQSKDHESKSEEMKRKPVKPAEHDPGEHSRMRRINTYMNSE